MSDVIVGTIAPERGTHCTVKMPIHCAAGGCSNTYKDGVSFFKFPKNQPRRRCWINKVLTTRDEWTASEYLMLCSRHFGEDCFEPEVAIAASLGINKRRKLKPTAVPSLFEKQPSTFESETGKVSRKRSYAHAFLDDTHNSSLDLSLSYSESSFESRSSDEKDCSSIDEHLGLEPYQYEPTAPESHEKSNESDSSDEDDKERLQATS